MTMSRRDFGRRSIGAIAVLAAGPSIMMLEGCTISKGQLKSYGDTLDQALAAILQFEGNVDLAAKIRAAQVVFDNAVENFDGASTTAIVISALNSLEAILGLIPATSVYLPLIDIVIAAAETIIANLPVNATTSPIKMAHTPVMTKTPHFKNPKDFAKAWNNQVHVNPSLANVRLITVH